MSKHKWIHPESSQTSTTAWRSAGQLEDTKEFRNWMDREFPQGAAELDIDDDGTSRRNFMQLMGGATALAGFGLASCRRPEQYIQPYADAPEWVIPGKPTYYTSAVPGPYGCLLYTSDAADD